MKITFKEWLVFIIIAAVFFGLWCKWGYPEFAFINLSVDRNKATQIAESYLVSQGTNPKGFLKAAIFSTDDWSDRYLQKAVGFKSEQEFIKHHDFEIMSWQVRFFKELQKEEYVIAVSPKSGNMLGIRHNIEDIETGGDIGKEAARKIAEDFFKDVYGLDFKKYEFHSENTKRYEKRTDYSFSWEKKGVYVPWAKNEGGAKLLTGATVTANKVREFYTNALDVPEKFRRFIEKQTSFGEYLSIFSYLAWLVLLIWSVYIVIKRQHNFVMHLCKKWYVGLGIFFLAANLILIFNNFQSILISYPTTNSLSSFLGVFMVKIIIGLIFVSIAFILPGLAGETLLKETLPHHKYNSFLHYLKSTWFSRVMSRSIAIGYLLFFIMLGFQSVLYYFGQRYLGVWQEWLILTQFSSAYLPFLSAFITASFASFSEEIVFRLFGITWGKKYFKSLFLAIIVSSVIWGISHTRYAIFPVWFRGFEVTLLGCLLGFIFVRYGIIPGIVAHYLLNAFWGTAAHVLGQSQPYLFFGSCAVLLLPAIFGVTTYFMNRSEKEREVRELLSPTQQYNLDILANFVALKKSQGSKKDEIRSELLQHNWDLTLIELALKSAFHV